MGPSTPERERNVGLLWEEGAGQHARVPLFSVPLHVCPILGVLLEARKSQNELQLFPWDWPKPGCPRPYPHTPPPNPAQVLQS